MKSKINQAALGFRVRSGWAATILLAGPVRTPRLCDIRVIDLCDPQIPATRQPYHAAMGKLETNAARLKLRLQIVRRAVRHSVAEVVSDYRRDGHKIPRAGFVVGSQIDPALIANPHIRAHALEGQLFRTALADVLRAHQIQSVVLTEREALAKAATLLKKIARGIAEHDKRNETDNERAVARRTETRDCRRVVCAGFLMSIFIR